MRLIDYFGPGADLFADRQAGRLERDAKAAVYSPNYAAAYAGLLGERKI